MSFYRDTWEDKKCHKVPNENLDCEMVVDSDAHSDNPSLKCCYPHNRSKCFPQEITIVDFSAITSTKVSICLLPKLFSLYSLIYEQCVYFQAKCKRACTWSDIKNRCVKRRARQKVRCYNGEPNHDEEKKKEEKNNSEQNHGEDKKKEEKKTEALAHWGEWEEWSNCTGFEQIGIKKRERTCSDNLGKGSCGHLKEHQERACLLS